MFQKHVSKKTSIERPTIKKAPETRIRVKQAPKNRQPKAFIQQSQSEQLSKIRQSRGFIQQSPSDGGLSLAFSPCPFYRGLSKQPNGILFTRRLPGVMCPRVWGSQGYVLSQAFLTRGPQSPYRITRVEIKHHKSIDMNPNKNRRGIIILNRIIEYEYNVLNWYEPVMKIDGG